jgi:hypothetical protein
MPYKNLLKDWPNNNWYGDGSGKNECSREFKFDLDHAAMLGE